MVVKIVYDNPCAYDIFGDCRPLHSLMEVGRQQPSSFTRGIWSRKVLLIPSVSQVCSSCSNPRSSVLVVVVFRFVDTASDCSVGDDFSQ